MATITWRRLMADAAQRLADAGFDSSVIEARRLAEEASGYEGGDFLPLLDAEPHERQVAGMERMLQRRLQGVPLQYALGRWSFRGLDLFVDERVLIPRPETEVVAEVAIAEAERLSEHPICVDLGTGSGAIALSLAADLPGASVWATDVSPDALAVAKANLTGLGQPARRVRMAEGWWFDALDSDLEGNIDLVVSNPPYIADHEELPAVVADHEPVEALFSGPSGLECIEAILDAAPRWLAVPGTVVLEIAPHQVDGSTALARGAGFGDVTVHRDLAGRERVLVARR